MSKFVIVLHKWFVDSNGFKVKEMESDNRKEVEREAKIWTHDNNYGMNHADYHIIELHKDETLKKPKGAKLSWKERILGRVCK